MHIKYANNLSKLLTYQVREKQKNEVNRDIFTMLNSVTFGIKIYF